MALIKFGTLIDRQPGNPDTPISRAQYDALAQRGAGHDRDFYALYDSNADGSWDTAFELSDTNGNSGRLATLAHDDSAADPVTITATGRVGASTVGDLTNDITYDNVRGFGVSSPGADDDGAHVLNSGEAIDFALNAVGGQAQILQKASFVVQTGDGEGRDGGHRNASPVSVFLDFDGSTLVRVSGHWQTSAAYALTNVHDGDSIIIDFVNRVITDNGHAVPNVPVEFWAAYQAAGAHNLTIGSGADDSRGFAVENLSLTTAAASAANHPAIIGDPTVHDVTEDVNPVGGNLVASGTIPVSDVDAGQSAFQTTVHSAAGNLGSLTLQASGAYTYSVANSAVQYLGALDSKLDTFTVTSIDGTQKQVTFTIHGTNDVPVIGGVVVGDVSEDSSPTTLSAAGALTISDADQGQSSFAPQVGTTGSNGYGTFSLDAAGHWTYAADNTQKAIQQLGAGQTITDSFTAVSSDGSANQVVTVTIHGVNDVPVIGGVATGDVTEDSNPTTLTAAGMLTISDADQGQSSFAAQAVTTGSNGYGTFTLDAAGHWTYAADDTQKAIQQLGAGQILTDSFTAVSSDGSANQVVTVTIHGVNDVPVMGGVATASVTEDSNPTTLTAAGALTISDADQGQSSFAAQASTTGSNGYGTFTLDAAGHWTYAADNTQTAIQQLNAGQTLTDSFTAVSIDGTASQLVTVTINGVDDAPVTTPVTLAPIAEDSGARVITQSELLANAADVDGPALSAVNLQIASGSGTLVDNGNGTWSYAPAANDDTAVSFSYQVSDGTLSTPGSATLDITPVNDPPVIAIAPSAVIVNFDALNPGSGVIDGAALSGYLAGFGIAISSNGSGADPTVADDRTIYGGGIVTATSGHNVLGEAGGFPVSYTATFAHPLSSFAFDRVTENPGPSGTAYPQWTATAYDAANHVLGSVGENATSIFPFNGPSPAVHYTLNGPQIDHVIFTGNDSGFAAFANVVTDSWVLSGSGGTTTAEDTPLTLPAISVSDIDAGSSPIQVSLAVGNGVLSLGSTAGLTVSGLGSGAVVLTGSQADIDSALASGLTYTPSLNYNGGDTLTITANDLGNTGAGGPLSTTQSINLTVTPVNDPAVISGTTTGTVVESGTWFGDEFNNTAATPTHWDMTGGPQWANAGRLIDPSGTEPFNNELQWYVNPATSAGAALPDPFNVGGGNLTITAAPASINNYYDHYNYSSGLVTSYDSYKALYGYFEMRAQLPDGKGLLPAFWLLPADGSHAELDAMEVLGSDPTTLYTTVHSYSTGSLVSTGAASTVADTSVGFHTYGVDWEPTTITWYFDGQQVFQTATPSDLNTPMYLIANLAVGGSWPGSPDGTTPFPANYNIDYIRAYGAPPPSATVTGTLTDTDVDNPGNTFQAVSAAIASDHGYGTFTMTAGGTWAYTLDNSNAAVQALNVGDTLTDTFTVHTIDGTAQLVTVTIEGANDSPTITSGQQNAVGSVTEDQYPLAGGQITSSDVDHNDTATWSVDGGHASQGDLVALLDDFKVTSASGVSFEDTFDGTVPLSGVGSPYGSSITTSIPEVDGRALLEGTLAGANGGFTTQNGTLTTPTTANGSPRLSQDTTFDATARYDFVNPEDTNQLYGIRLTDRINTSTGVDTLELSVRRDLDGHLAVQFRDIDLTTNTATTLGEVAIDPAQLAGSQIVLHLVHGTAGSNNITASFDVIDSGGNTTSFNVPGTGQIFTVPGEDWTRAQFVAREPTETDSTKLGVYGTLAVDQQGHWQYLLNNSAPNVQALAAGQHVTDGFDVLVTDSHGGIATQHVAIDVAGTNDAPVLQTPGGGTQSFDPNAGLSFSDTMTFSDVDLADIHSVTLTPQGNGYLGTANAVVSTESTGTGNGMVTLSYTLTPAQYEAANGNIPATQTYLATLTDNHGLSSTQLVSLPLAQMAGPYFAPPDNPPVIAGVQTTAFVLDSNGHNPVTLTGSFTFTDVDQLDHHTLSMDVQPVGFAPAALGSLSYSFAGGNDGYGSGAGTVNWTYTVDPSTWPGGVIHHEYLDIVVTDSAGAHASHTLDIDYEPGATTTSSSLSVSIGGTAQEDQTLSAQASGYDANAVLTYQWQSSSDNGATWSAIAGATASTYAVQESDENSIIRVMATDAGDSVNTFSAATAPVVDAYPSNASVTISGVVQQGQTLDANLSVGTDSDLGTATFRWQVSTDSGQHWTDIAGATGAHYTATEADENNLLRVAVTATDDTNQSISLVSAATVPVLDNVSTAIQGNTAQPAEGQILTATFIGDNDGNGASNTFEWQSSSDNGASWTDIAGATAQTYQVQEADEGHLLRVIGHGVEIGGDPVSVASAPTGAVVDVPLTASVTIAGTAQEGQTLTANASTNDSDGVISGYQWQSSADNGTTWTNISGATAAAYTLVEADENHLIRVSVAAQDADGGGSATSTSAATSSVIDVTSVATVTIGVGSGLAVQGAQSFSKFFGFGDSNIDSGYFFTHAISNNSTLQAQYNAAVAAGGGLPTSIGGTMNSQLLAADYGLTAIPIGEVGGTNYAASGATVTGSLSGSLAPSVTSQIQTYLTSTNGVADPNALYLISGGGNDFKIAQTLSGQTAQFNYMISAANALTTALLQLQAAGAKYVVIDDGAGRNALISEFNTTLWAGLDAAGMHYIAADDANLVRQITANPAPYGITNTVQPPAGPFTAANPYNPANGGADIDPLPSQVGKGWSLYATTMQSANAGQTYLWSDNEHLTAAGKLAEANYTHNLIQNSVPTPGEVLTANPALVGETDNAAATFAFQWQHSFDDGHTWSNIVNATGKNYTVAAADDGARLRVVATATDDTGDVITAVSPETYAVSDGAEAPSVSAPSSLSAAAGGSVALPITVTTADADDVLGNVTISGLPGDVTLTDSNNDALVVNNGSITLTQAELAGLTLHVGSTAATLSITADASEGGSTATSAVQHVALDVSIPLSVSNFVNLTAPGSLNGIGGASDITNAGIVVGQNETYDLGYIQGGDGWLYDPATNVYTFVHIGNQNSVSDLNDYGVMAGFYSPNNSTPRYGFIENGVGQPVTTIDLTPNVSTDVEGINDSGDYVGSSYQHGGNTYSAFSVVGGVLTYFNPFGSTDAHANGINNAGDIVGTYGTHSYLEHNGVFTTIDMPGATRTAATDINNAGQVVGVYWDAAGHTHGYIETNGVFVTVDHPLGTNGTGVYGLNDAGQIAGNYYDASNSPKAYIATINNPVGAATDDVLVANPQGATLVGGAGNDTFVFTAAPQAANTIADFTPGSDAIQVSAFGFGGGLAHGVSPTVLTGTPAGVTNAGPGGDFIFDNSDPNGGTLYWDANGGSGADATLVAVMHGVSTLLPTDFHVV